MSSSATSSLARQIPPIEEVDRELAERYLDHFIRQAWHVVEPTTRYVPGWHIEAICEHLEAVTRGEIRRLLINIPPRHMKSLAVAVFWPAWEWIRNPSGRWLFSSYAQDLSTRDSLKCRRLIQSRWYWSNWGGRFRITSDQNQKMRFENDRTGYRLATSVEGINTGEGGDKIVADDPHNVKQAESDAKREGVLVWWDEVMSTRLNDPRTGARVIIMQRVHDRDLSGHVLEQGGYVHLCLPARYEGNRVKTVVPLARPFKDPRKKQGEPLWKDKYGDRELTDLERELGEYGTAGQLQQRPAPRGGGMFKVERFQRLKAINRQRIAASVRYWDKAGTEGGGSFTAGVLMHRMAEGYDPRYVVEDVRRGQWSTGNRETRIKGTANDDGRAVQVWVEQEPGSGGKESAENTIRNLAGYVVRADRVTGSKEVRAQPYAAQVEIGNVGILDGANGWARGFVDEHERYPVGRYKDQVDGAAGAFNKLHAVRYARTFGTRRI